MNIRTGVVKLIDQFGLPRWKHYSMNFTTFRSLLVLWLPIKVTYCYWGNRIPVINVSQEKLRLQENISNSSQFFMDFEIYLHIYWMPWGLFSLLELVLLIEGFNFRETSFFLILSILNKIWRPFRNIVNWKMLLGFSLIRIYIYIYIYTHIYIHRPWKV